MSERPGPDRDLLESRLSSLLEALDALEELRTTTLDQYRSDVVRRSAIERLLCRLVEVAAEANAHVSATVLGRAPADYHDSFIKAAEAGLLDAPFATEIARSAGLRNRLVHEYETVDHAVVHGAVPVAIDQFRRYVEQVSVFLEGLKEG